jgi:hypothetical protein
MDSLYGAKEEMEFSVMDARNLEYIPEQCFDVVIDKGFLRKTAVVNLFKAFAV